MPATRPSQGEASPNGNGASKKREAVSSLPPEEPNKKAKIEKDQKTIEETLNGASEGLESEQDIAKQINTEKSDENDKVDDLEAREKAVQKREEEVAKKEEDGSKEEKEEKNGHEEVKSDEPGTADAEPEGEVKNAFEEVKSDEPGKTDLTEQEGKEKNPSEQAKPDDSEKTGSIETAEEKPQTSNQSKEAEDNTRTSQIPSSILEKGLIYFFFRSRVGVTSPQGIEDIARSYIVLRPLALGSSLSSSSLTKDTQNARLLALPKKVLPTSTRDRFLMFVEKTEASIEDLKGVFEGDEYATKTQGTTQVPAVTPFAEGIYAITSTNSGRDSHLAYHLTVPGTLGPIQKTLGLANPKGSYAISVKNPTASGPANATLSTPAQYPAEIQDKFGGRRWMPLQPEVLAYVNTQFLVIGEGKGDALKEGSGEKEKETPEEEMEKLEEEDEDRIRHLEGDDPVFVDLGLSSDEFKGLQTTW